MESPAAILATQPATGSDGINIPERVRAEDVLQMIDAAVAQLEEEEQPSGFIATLVTPGARHLVGELNRARAMKFTARRELCQRIVKLLDVYVGAHRASLWVRGYGFVQQTFHELEGPLFAAAETAVTSFYDTLVFNVGKVESMPLSDAQKADYARAAYEAVVTATADTRVGYRAILNQLRAEFESVVREVLSYPGTKTVAR